MHRTHLFQLIPSNTANHKSKSICIVCLVWTTLKGFGWGSRSGRGGGQICFSHFQFIHIHSIDALKNKKMFSRVAHLFVFFVLLFYYESNHTLPYKQTYGDERVTVNLLHTIWRVWCSRFGVTWEVYYSEWMCLSHNARARVANNFHPNGGFRGHAEPSNSGDRNITSV